MPSIFSINHGHGAKLCSKEDFHKLFGVRYLDSLEFADWRVESYLRKKCAAARKQGRIEELTIWLGNLHKREIAEGADVDVLIQWIDDQMGYGLFTNRSLPAWHYVGEYTGLLRKRGLLKRDVNDYCFQYPREWMATKAFTIDSEDQGNYTRFINHSDTPNLESRSFFHDGVFHIAFRTLKVIEAGSELTYDYGDAYWSDRKKAASYS